MACCPNCEATPFIPDWNDEVCDVCCLAGCEDCIFLGLCDDCADEEIGDGSV